MTEHWYRYEDYRTANMLDEWDNPTGSTQRVCLMEMRVLKHTPKGVWLQRWPRLDGRRFCLAECRKRYAAPTREEALRDFLARKQRQLAIYQAKIIGIKEAVRLAKSDILGG